MAASSRQPLRRRPAVRATRGGRPSLLATPTALLHRRRCGGGWSCRMRWSVCHRQQQQQRQNRRQDDRQDEPLDPTLAVVVARDDPDSSRQHREHCDRRDDAHHGNTARTSILNERVVGQFHTDPLPPPPLRRSNERRLAIDRSRECRRILSSFRATPPVAQRLQRIREPAHRRKVLGYHPQAPFGRGELLHGVRDRISRTPATAPAAATGRRCAA